MIINFNTKPQLKLPWWLLKNVYSIFVEVLYKQIINLERHITAYKESNWPESLEFILFYLITVYVSTEKTIIHFTELWSDPEANHDF